MKFFVDTANLEEIREANDMGVLDGVTTNPSLVKAEGNVDFHERVLKICEVVQGDVSAEVTATDFDGMMEEAHTLAQIHDNVVVKIPLIKEGIKALRALDDEGIRTNCTLCFSPTQALVAAKAGADYISPFIGRIDDISSDGMTLIEEIVQIYDNYDFETEVLAASIRHPTHVKRAALAGADVATMPFETMVKLLDHPLTDRGLERFLEDWEEYQEAKEEEAATAAV
ncbi:fructose-6-phosphate aldolase [Salinibacter sp. 10B]|uniref:fructose-6-phosphate aldolase n=1 Tax=Salinibacter sp. 10B TaxID=1923971 RepID=UPI000CF4E286|nr:fructose-6-phosphate aldolase [Salinibacter sp. 10B]PQJ35104.1 fructose-6-phosphate aldolase [Salinibacter sp. 10B]